MSEFFLIEVDWESINIKEGDVLSDMGISPEKVIDTEFSDIIQHILQGIAKCYPLPSFCLCFTEGVIDGNGNINLTSSRSSQIFNIGNIINNQLKNSERYVIFTATAGLGFDHFYSKVKDENDIAKNYITDIIGSIIAERCADAVEKKLDTLLGKDFHHTNRFSPGYCGWNVNEQKKLFSLFPINNPCGIELSSSSLMLPIKSVSGLIGIGKKVRKLEYSCGLCNLKDCYKRKAKTRN